ncbi:hypothetical protein LKK83_19435 [Phormidium sp. CCY1219]|nr:hypothetical protein [Phormidium sp. CCY1219]
MSAIAPSNRGFFLFQAFAPLCFVGNGFPVFTPKPRSPNPGAIAGADRLQVTPHRRKITGMRRMGKPGPVQALSSKPLRRKYPLWGFDCPDRQPLAESGSSGSLFGDDRKPAKPLYHFLHDVYVSDLQIYVEFCYFSSVAAQFYGRESTARSPT